MALSVTFEITLQLNTREQVDKIWAAVDSGLMETVIKEGVLFGRGNTVEPSSATNSVSGGSNFAASAKKGDSSAILKPIGLKVPSRESPVTQKTEPEVPAKGVMGRSRLRRR